MKTLTLILAAACVSVVPRCARTQAPARWQQHARNVTIVRDDWGIAHVYGVTDADAVFGMEYAQAEDDFNRVETNYINALGRLAETEGASQIYRDLRMKLFMNPDSLRAKYAASPPWLRALMVAFADGLNFYLYTHPQVKPRVITHFEPWMALAFSEGSIGGDIEQVDLRRLAAFYGDIAAPAASIGDGPAPEPSGSNGIAIAPSITADHHALLWINPHTSFYFRSELQMASQEGLDAYGAVTWGQFFVYQGFNPRAGWMHTSSGVDAVDEYLETVMQKDGKYYYKYGGRWLPMTSTTITVPYRTSAGMARKIFTAYYTRHGPVIRKDGDKWVSISLMQLPIKALEQSYLRTKATSYKAYLKTMQLHANSSNNTMYADADGHIAYFHANFIPRRDTSFDWTKPVDGSNPATDWGPVLSVDQSPHLLDPKSGWLYNSNNWPWSAAGPYSPKRSDFPRYVETGTEESPRGHHALRLLTGAKNVTMSSLTAMAFDSYLPAFAQMIPPLLKAYDQLPASDSSRTALAAQIAMLRGWDYRWGASSVPTSLAVFWGENVLRRVAHEARAAGASPMDFVANGARATDLLQSLAAASARLTHDFGSWKTPWGNINRFQRLDDTIESHFDDAQPSDPVPFTSSRWGSLASFGARPYANTKKWYGTKGNSFVAVVEFTDSVRARAVTAGGESGNPASPHFRDEIARYTSGNLRTVYFYRSQLKGHTEREYHPGSR
ncbi:MAG: penicillin acylase family protein [Gemmatimonadaceae bacterium]